MTPLPWHSVNFNVLTSCSCACSLFLSFSLICRPMPALLLRHLTACRNQPAPFLSPETSRWASLHHWMPLLAAAALWKFLLQTAPLLPLKACAQEGAVAAAAAHGVAAAAAAAAAAAVVATATTAGGAGQANLCPAAAAAAGESLFPVQLMAAAAGAAATAAASLPALVPPQRLPPLLHQLPCCEAGPPLPSSPLALRWPPRAGGAACCCAFAACLRGLSSPSLPLPANQLVSTFSPAPAPACLPYTTLTPTYMLQ
jgi:hypothetical protein